MWKQLRSGWRSSQPLFPEHLFHHLPPAGDASSTRARLMASGSARPPGLRCGLRAVAHEAGRHPRMRATAMPCGQAREEGHVLRIACDQPLLSLSRSFVPGCWSGLCFRSQVLRRTRPRPPRRPVAAIPESRGTPVSSSTTCCASSSVMVGSLRRRPSSRCAPGAPALVGVFRVHRRASRSRST